MRILHTGDLHLGQILYQYYERVEEHRHFFAQLEQWCEEYKPDALLVSGDIFDIQQPSAAVRDFFNSSFASLHRRFPHIQLVITAGNHDSAARIEADREVWGLSEVKLIGHAPSPEALNGDEGWQDRFIVEIDSGFIIALPFMSSVRTEVVQSVLDRVSVRNADGRPVVMMAHQALSGCDISGHGEIGNLRSQTIDEMGTGYDYLALGHIHRPQTMGQKLSDENDTSSTYTAGAVRYAGSPVSVSGDEQYTHSVSLVDIDHHGGTVGLTRLPVNQLYEFHILPSSGQEAAKSAEEVFGLVDEFCANSSGYFRLRIDSIAALPADFTQTIYRKIEATEGRVRWNPNTITENEIRTPSYEKEPVFKVAELQQMSDPLVFIRKTIDQYPELNIDELVADFKEIEDEIRKGDMQK